MHKWSKLKVMEKIWNPNINRQLDEADTIIEASEDGMKESSDCSFAAYGYFNCRRATLKSRKDMIHRVCETTAKGTGLAEKAGKEDPIELDSSLAL
ncbi:hypothetical protein chiPu_0024973 [Chiloscyllium punctatum]|uniref:Uncharacterized protein n=1 Tax=Chiloscyllium punctatum TaxID=137246 RepID=A0A401TDQ5_CHIPU|nr:hypothetical protein [Chiloscyllium punctatum]